MFLAKVVVYYRPSLFRLVLESRDRPGSCYASCYTLDISGNVYCWGSILERKELATLTGRAPELCGRAL